MQEKSFVFPQDIKVYNVDIEKFKNQKFSENLVIVEEKLDSLLTEINEIMGIIKKYGEKNRVNFFATLIN